MGIILCKGRIKKQKVRYGNLIILMCCVVFRLACAEVLIIPDYDEAANLTARVCCRAISVLQTVCPYSSTNVRCSFQIKIVRLVVEIIEDNYNVKIMQ